VNVMRMSILGPRAARRTADLKAVRAPRGPAAPCSCNGDLSSLMRTSSSIRTPSESGDVDSRFVR